MSVLCCRVPRFLVTLACRADPTLAGQPLALVGADGRVWAASPAAWLSGVRHDMRPQQALMRCPDLTVRALDDQAAQDEQAAFLGTLAAWELPVEAHTWGLAYVDLHRLTQRPNEVQTLCTDLGRQLRARLGAALTPSLGWDSGKFTARAAATRTRAGQLRLVGKGDEARFLNPLSLHLLPLPALSLQHLQWLGICTLGQFAGLPAVAVWQRFGPAGKVAQQWAKGKDTRPVRATVGATPEPVAVDFAPPVVSHPPVLAAVLRALRPSLTALARQMAGCRRLRLTLRFADRSERVLDCAFVEPVGDGERLRWALANRLQGEAWPAAVDGLSVTVLETGELAQSQRALWPQWEQHGWGVAEVARQLAGRYGPIFFRGQVVDAAHPLAERRASLSVLN